VRRPLAHKTFGILHPLPLATILMHIIGEVYLKISEDILQCYTYIFTDVHENMSTHLLVCRY